MTTYTAITNGEIDTDSPLTTGLMTKYRDNPIALAEGATGAPRILRPAFDNGVLLEWAFDYGTGADGAKTVSASENASNLSYHYTTYTVDASQTVTGVDGLLIIRATTSITINGTITTKALGPLAGTAKSADNDGNNGTGGTWGGTGGGGGAGATGRDGGDGGATFQTAGGVGATGLANGGAGNSPTAAAKRYFTDMQSLFNPTLSISTNAVRQGGSGGGSGGGAPSGSSGAGGRGGGVIILIAPLITVGSGGSIDADGEDGYSGTGSNNGGGGGGGGGHILIVTPSGSYTDSSGGGVHAAGGAASSGTSFYEGGAGGAGYVENYII